MPGGAAKKLKKKKKKKMIHAPRFACYGGLFVTEVLGQGFMKKARLQWGFRRMGLIPVRREEERRQLSEQT